MIDDDGFFGRRPVTTLEPRSTTSRDRSTSRARSTSRDRNERARHRERTPRSAQDRLLTTVRNPSAGPRTAPARPSGPSGRGTGPAPRRDRSRPQRSRPPLPTWTSGRRSSPPELGAPSRVATRRRLFSLVAIAALLVVAITARLVDLQVTGRDRYVAYGASQRDGVRTLPASRGGIYDREGNALALTVAVPQLVANPSRVKDPVDLAARIAPIAGLDEAQLVEDLSTDRKYKIITTELTDEQVTEIQAVLKKQAIDGLYVEDRFVRTNPSEGLARSVIGRSLDDGQVQEAPDGTKTQGLSGLELQYDQLLTGVPGQLRYERGADGKTIVGGTKDVTPAKPGTDLYLTVDQALQYETEQALIAQVDATRAESAQAVIMRPSTGEILSMSSVHRNDEGKVVPSGANTPVTALYEPGSVNKVVTIAAGLEEGTIEPSSTLWVPDSLQIYDRTFTDHDPHPDVLWSVPDILVTSSNIGTIKIAQGLGKAKVHEYLRAFGFGESTGLGFPNEENGILHDVDRWSGVDIGSVPIGQGISVTSLQMLAAYNTIANDGVYVAPRLIGGTDDGSGRRAAEPSAQRRVISPETAGALQTMLVQAVDQGTGKLAAVSGYESAGKTGTARIPQSGGSDATDGYRDASGRYHYASSFVGFVAGADLSVLVTVIDPQTSIYGGEVAAPVFAKLAATALRQLQIAPPSLATAERHEVPELSSTAKEIDGEDVTPSTLDAAG